MKKRFLLMAVLATMAVGANAQTELEGGVLVDVLPEGVKANVNNSRKDIKDKNIIVAGSPEKGYKAFFAADDGVHGEELWVTDGTKEGTHMVKDILPGSGSSNPSNLGRLNDKVLFSAVTEDGAEPWVSDGTEEGTFMLADLNLYDVKGSRPIAFHQMDETRAIFAAIDDESQEFDVDAEQQWLYITDGTPEGTKRVVPDTYADDEDFYIAHQPDMKFPGQDNTDLHSNYVRVGRRVFFKADKINKSTGEELWVTDGTAEGTYMVMDINWERWGEGQPGYEEGYTRNAGLDNLFNFDNKGCMFQAWTPDYGGEPWYTDGMVADEVNVACTEYGVDGRGSEHTYMIADTKPGRGDNGLGLHAGTFGVGVQTYKGRVYWRGYDPKGGYELGGSNCEKDDYVFYDIWDEEPSVDHNSYTDPNVVFDGLLIFCAAHGFDAAREDHYGGELWAFDGEKVFPQYGNWQPSTHSNWQKEPVVAGGSLYWWNEENWVAGGFGTGLYRLDASDAEPVYVTKNTIDPDGDMVHTIRNMGNGVAFASGKTNRVYVYTYAKPGWDGESDKGMIEPDFGPKDTGIAELQHETKAEEGVYNLNGMKVANSAEGLQKGVYVVNGKKAIVK
jgi:ELWxxDGT repeat protein